MQLFSTSVEAEQFAFIYQNRRQARTWTFFILAANPRVEVLSPIALVAGLSVHITEMRALPDKQGCSIRVSFELRYGTWSLIFKKGKPIAASATVKTATHDFPLDAFSASVAITVPRVSRLKYATSQRTQRKKAHPVNQPCIDIFSLPSSFFVTRSLL